MVTDDRGKILYWNPPVEELLGWPAGERYCAEAVRTLIVDKPGVWRRILVGLERDGEWVGDLTVRRQCEGPVRVHATISKLSGSDGRPGAIVCMARPQETMTAPQAGLAETARPLDQHQQLRANLQVVSSLLSLQARRVNDMFRDTQNRIKSMAIVHEKLSVLGAGARVDMAEYLQNLLDHVLDSYGTGAGKVRVQARLEEIRLVP